MLLTCDTLYSTASMPHLLKLVDSLLSTEVRAAAPFTHLREFFRGGGANHALSWQGVALVAAKRFYFGVGGTQHTYCALHTYKLAFFVFTRMWCPYRQHP